MRKLSSSGFTLVEIMIVVTIIGMLSAIAMPQMKKVRDRARRQACISNIRLLSGAKQQWALENFEPPTAAPVAAELDPYVKGGTAKLLCPADPRKTFATSYAIRDVASEPVCNIFPSDHAVQ